MGLLTNLSTKTKLILSFTIIVVLNMISSLLTVHSTLQTVDAAHDIDELLRNTYIQTSEVQRAVQIFDAQVVIALNPINLNIRLKDYVHSYKQDMAQLRDTLAKLNTNNAYDAKVASEINRIKQDIESYLTRYENEIIKDICLDESKGNAVERATLALHTYLLEISPILQEINADIMNSLKTEIDYTLDKAAIASDMTSMLTSSTFTAISILIAIVVAVSISTYISKRITKITYLINRTKAGYLDDYVNIKANDEFGMATRTLMSTNSTLKDILSSVKNATVETQDKLSRLIAVAHDILDKANSAEGQAVNVAAASEELVSTISDIAKNCEQATLSSNSSKEIIDHGNSIMQDAAEQVMLQNKSTEKNASMINQLSSKTTHISTIVSTIEDIASQTNLLALNAAIEAARAGEAGRGFAVVADEIRGLAMRTAESTKEIANMVNSVQNEALASAQSIEENATTMQQIYESSSQVSSVFTNMVSVTDKVNEQIIQISTATEQQNITTAEISSNMQNITQSVQDVASCAQQVVENVNATVNEMNIMMGVLRDKMAFFKL